MALRYRHEVVAPSLHRFVFPSESRPGRAHELLLDLDATGADRLSCLCEASLYGKVCKHKRAIIRGALGERDGFGREARRWLKRRARARRRREATV